MMESIQKSLVMAFLIVSIFISGLRTDLVGAQAATKDATSTRQPADFLKSKYIRFTRFTAKDGLSTDQTFYSAHDRYGFIWFATIDGLNRFDGAEFKIYRHDADEPSSLSNNIIRAMIVDQNGIPWLGTYGGGLNRYDPEKDAFIHYRHNPDDPKSLSNDRIQYLYEDPVGTIWVGTAAGGLNKLNLNNGQFTRYQHDPDDPHSLSHNHVFSIFTDSAGVLWVGTQSGLNQFDPKTERFIRHHHEPDDPASLSHDRVRGIFEDSSGILWLSTAGGLNKFNRDRTRFTRYLHDNSDPNSLSNNVVTDIHEDRAGSLWVTTWGGGLNRFDRETESFTRFRHDPSDPYSLVADTIYDVYEDQQGILWFATIGGVSILDGGGRPFQHYRPVSYLSNTLSHNVVRALHAGQKGIVWVGTEGGGLNKFDRYTEEFTHYRNDPADPGSLSENSVRAVYEDSKGLVWIGTEESGLNRFDPETDGFSRFPHDPADPHSISKGSIMGISEDRSGTIWISMWGGGLNAFDRGSELFTRYHHDPTDPQSLSSNVVIAVFEDREGELWIATYGGLNKFNRETETFIRYQHDAANQKSLAHNGVTVIHEDETGTLWVGTLGGLDKFDRQNEQFTHYKTADGLPSNTIHGILEDEKGQLWLSTTNGLSRFDPRSESVINFDVSDGLQSRTFLNYESYTRSKDGEMFFGGPNGFNAFYPDKIVNNPYPPPVVITNFQLSNRSIPIGDGSVLKKSILDTDVLFLSYLDRMLSFEFASLNYRAPEKNFYKFRMEGFEKGWNKVDSTRRFVTYTNLDPGNYVFRVIASNNDGIWNEEGRSIRITITPPWWETNWFRVCLVVTAVAMMAGGFRWRVSAIEANRRGLEVQVKRRTEELEKANTELEDANNEALEARNAAETANQAKSIFLANMSHELRTPLNAILGFSRMLTNDKDATEKQKEKLTIISRSGKHLLAMINDVLDVSKIEADRIELQEYPVELASFLKEMSAMIQSRATEKGISVDLDLNAVRFSYVKADVGKLRQIVTNLLSNAVKFTDEGGVTIRCATDAIPEEPKHCTILIEVEDTGLGIDPTNQTMIFEPFVQGVDMPTRIGTGLGLSICKKYADFMGGTIELESEVGKGSLFRVRLPAEIAEMVDALIPADDQPRVVGLAQNQKTWRIIVADDNRDNLLLLKSLLEQVGFIVLGAENGKEAVEMFKKKSPDLIWIDMRMPVMDGYAATRRIRNLSGGKEVKIVAITASAFKEQRPDILAAGCDELVYKPYRDHDIFETMARLLDIKYLYEQKSEPMSRKEKIDLTAEMLADLPGDLLQELREATLVLNRDAAFEAIVRIADQAPEMAAGLRVLVENFQMVELRDLLGMRGIEND